VRRSGKAVAHDWDDDEDEDDDEDDKEDESACNWANVCSAFSSNDVNF